VRSEGVMSHDQRQQSGRRLATLSQLGLLSLPIWITAAVALELARTVSTSPCWLRNPELARGG
jgi:hypothetical protein